MFMLVSGFGPTYFFFQAEDGIRGYKVTGVQTCALPIWNDVPGARWIWIANRMNPATATTPARLVSHPERGASPRIATRPTMMKANPTLFTKSDRKSVV